MIKVKGLITGQLKIYFLVERNNGFLTAQNKPIRLADDFPQL